MILDICRKARKASVELAKLSAEVKNKALHEMAEALEKNIEAILEANRKDVENAKARGVKEALIDRLILNKSRIGNMAKCLREVADLPDPVGEIVRTWTRPNGLIIGQLRVPLGVVAVIYESRPDVTSDASGICLKSGNAIILRGGSDAINSNVVIGDVLSEASTKAGIPDGAIQVVRTTERSAATELMKMREYVDALIPRGGAGLINAVVENAKVPVIETGVGNCHVYVEQDADLDRAVDIVINAKCQRPGTCNSAEKLLVHKNIAESFLPKVIPVLRENGVEVRGDEETKTIVPDVKSTTEEDWYTEYLDLIMGVKVVTGLDEAINHINKYGTKHSESILTSDFNKALKFIREVDAAAVYWNASTRFTDGNQYGLGAEIGISTQKLHARGPMSVQHLTTTKYFVLGRGHIRE
ncbi:MAG: glutamate-5-semialdehyde dehydrogenase [Candidatus Bathyarchaeota archaeon]|nr:glutamate-5-semialdehyde dehydrogenase [Candidatus Bathyarchaeota archaeon]MDH5687978.1 glutamate-5-semialdehyde dehydrogenase [Candidatus Bathyarchaeota archaeon]